MEEVEWIILDVIYTIILLAVFCWLANDIRHMNLILSESNCGDFYKSSCHPNFDSGKISNWGSKNKLRNQSSKIVNSNVLVLGPIYVLKNYGEYPQKLLWLWVISVDIWIRS